MNGPVDPISETSQTKLSEAWRILGKLGHVDTIFNHISIASRDVRGVLQVTMNPDGYLPSEVLPARMMTFPIEGIDTVDAEKIGVNRDGFELHSTVHRARMAPGTVLHTHSPYALAVGATSRGLLPLSQTAMEFVQDAIYIEYDGLFRNLAENPAFAEFSVRGGIAFLRNHGTLIVTEHIEDAVYIQHFLEDACKMQVITLSQNQELLIPPDVVIKNASNILKQDRHREATKLFGAFRRTLLS